MLQLVTGPRQRACERVVRVARHPAEELRGRGERAELGRCARRAAQVRRRLERERRPTAELASERAEQVRAAALVLACALLAVLVAADRDVLGAVVGRQLGASQRKRRRQQREHAADELPRAGSGAASPLIALTTSAVPDHRREHLRPLERQLSLRRRRRPAAGAAKTSAQPGRAAQDRILTSAARSALYSSRDLQLAVGPCAPRTAQECGPCTSTPFTSAIPPRRTFSAIGEKPQLTAGHLDGDVPEAVAPRARGRRSRSARPAEWISRAASCGSIAFSREEAVRDGAERLAQPVAVGEPGHADRQHASPRLDPRDEALDRVTRAAFRARSACRRGRRATRSS